MAELYAEQIAGERYFLHAHPMYATSWSLPCIEELMQHPDVQRVRADQCQFGAAIQSGEHRGDPIMKPSGFMTNAPMIARVLDVQCGSRDGLCTRPA